MSYTLFYMWDWHRRTLIAGHRFYIEQARERLLSQFLNIESEADQATATYLENRAHHFDPDRHDPADVNAEAHSEGVAFYQLLSDMEERTRLSVIAGMYYEWDKQLRDWLTKEIRHWSGGGNLQDSVWRASFDDLIDLFVALGWSIKSNTYYSKLDALHLVVNVFKHGKGSSFLSLKERYPAYLANKSLDLGEWSFDTLEYTSLKISDCQIEEFSEAILSFWQDVPERIEDHDSLFASVPNWFQKALKKDSSSMGKS